VKLVAKWPFYRWFVSKLDACLPVGKWSSEYFLHYGARPDRVFVVPHSVDTDYFANEAQRLEAERPALRASWGLAASTTVFVFAGKFISKKRPLDFVSAIKQARSRGANIEGLMVGDGPLRGVCEEAVRAAELPIRFAGFLNQTEIARAYVAADALVLPSNGGETWGLVVNEAMACGLPCFVSDRVGCGADMVRPDETGAVFPMGDTATLGRLMADLAANPKRLKAMRSNATQEAEKYSVNVAVARTVEALERVAQ
jgi:glycosyltransferase involved in cell wall biosynthesis